jgi:hypothetical protein
MKKLVFLFALVLAPMLASQTAFAEGDGSVHAPGGMMINEGDLEIGGDGSFSRLNQGDRWDLAINTKIEYFFLNRFSGGARLQFTDSNVESTSVQVGPSATYYFAIVRNLAMYVDTAILWTNPKGSGDNYIYGDTGIGLDFFVRPNIAVGPSVRGIYYFNGDNGLPPGRTDIRFNISTFF